MKLGVSMIKDYAKDYVAFDLETTGLNAEFNEIIEIGAWKVRNNHIVSRFHSLVRPDNGIPYNISRLTGITWDMVEEEAGLYAVLPYFYDFCKGCPLIAHNAPFDSRFVCNYGKQLGLPFDEFRYIDTLEIARSGKVHCTNNKLCTLAEELKLEVDESLFHNHSRGLHSALYDSYLVHKLYEYFREH